MASNAAQDPQGGNCVRYFPGGACRTHHRCRLLRFCPVNRGQALILTRAANKTPAGVDRPELDFVLEIPKLVGKYNNYPRDKPQ
jgi:hypothetical protein